MKVHVCVYCRATLYPSLAVVWSTFYVNVLISVDETGKGGIVMHKNSGLVAKREYLFPSARVLFFSLNYVHFHV